MDNEKNLVIPIGGNEDELPLSPEEKAAEEKASRRKRYICARVSADSLARRIERIESGACASGDLEFLRAQLFHSRMRVAEFEAEFASDPNIEQDVQRERQATEDIAKAFYKKKDTGK